MQILHTFGKREWFFSGVIYIIVLTNLVVILNLPIFRQIFGIILLGILPGVLILRLINLNNLSNPEKFTLIIGLSVAFNIIFGIIINAFLPLIGYAHPITTVTIVVSFGILLLILALVGYYQNVKPLFEITPIILNNIDKILLTISISLIPLCVYGLEIMNRDNNNTVILFFYFLIPVLVILISIYNKKINKKIYPVFIGLISLSLLLTIALRSRHIIGVDTHDEYYLFLKVLGNQIWTNSGSLLDSALSINLYPAIIQSVIAINPEILFKTIGALICFIAPLCVFAILRNYTDEFTAFIGSFFFISQYPFLSTPLMMRTIVAITFFLLFLIVLLKETPYNSKKTILMLIFLLGVVLSHYATAYIILILIAFAYILQHLLQIQDNIKQHFNSILIIIFILMIYFWQVLSTPIVFNTSMNFIDRTYNSFKDLFIFESNSNIVHSSTINSIIGKSGIINFSVQLEYLVLWSIFILIGLGLFVIIITNYAKVIDKNYLLKKVFQADINPSTQYMLLSIVSIGILILTLMTPYISIGYGAERLYLVTAVFLIIPLILGSKLLINFIIVGIHLIYKKILSTNLKIQETKEKHPIYNKERMQTFSQLLLIIILVFYYLSITGITYQIEGIPRSMIMNSEGNMYGTLYVHDQETSAAIWLKHLPIDYTGKINTDGYGYKLLISQAQIIRSARPSGLESIYFMRYQGVINNRIYVYNNVKLIDQNSYYLSNLIYNTKGSKIFKELN